MSNTTDKPVKRLTQLPIAVQQVNPSAPIGSFPGFPREVREIHQIELTSRCNLRCRYCPHPHLPRPKEDMAWETFEQALLLVRHYVMAGTQTELSLTGIGESLMHPRFVDMVEAARRAIGPNRPLVIASNGVEMTEEIARAMIPFNPRFYISMHRPEVAAPAAVMLQRYGLLAGVNNAFVTSAFDWAGQLKELNNVEWHVNAPQTTCEYLRAGWAVVLQDGRITTCCLDASGAGVVGSVWDSPDKLFLQPYSLCNSCHMTIPERV